MIFNEIFEQDGLYAAEVFCAGTAFRIQEGALYIETYDSVNDFRSNIESYHAHRSLFSKEYVRVNNIRQLFK